MDKPHRGFGVLEILIAIAILLVGVTMVAPSLDRYYARQHLKLNVVKFSAFVETARELAASTECPTQVAASQDDGKITVEVRVRRSTLWKGCVTWFEANRDDSSAFIPVSAGSLEKTTSSGSLSLSFDGVSGSLTANTNKHIELRTGSQIAVISYGGINNGLVRYVN